MMSENIGLKNINFSVDGMHCIKCIRKIQGLADGFNEIESVKVDLGTKKISLKIHEDFDPSCFEQQVRSAGFGIRLATGEEVARSSENKTFLFQIGVAGFCSGNIMMLAAAEYVGAAQEAWSRIFPIASAILFLPVLLFSAQPFLLNSFYALRARRISIDTPLALAIYGGALLSYWQLYLQKEGLYFDSLAMFVFFLLSSRYLVYKTQNKFLSPVKIEDVYSLKNVTVLSNDLSKMIPVEKVRVGDVVSVPRNQFIPLDGELISDRALVSDAFFSGEFLPKEKNKFDLLYAGSKNLTGELQLRVKKELQSTRLSEIVEKLNQSLSQKTEISLLSDRGANYLTFIVVGLSLLTIGYFAFVDINEGLSRVLALLVVACPCGLAIAVPLLQSLALKLGLKKSLLIKKPSVLESIPKVKAVIFDKTGTLTSGEIRVTHTIPREPNDLEKQIIFSLEKNSEHPIALAIVKWLGEQVSICLDGHDETFGKGVSAYYNDDYYEVVSSRSQDIPAVQFLKNNTLQFTIYLNDSTSAESIKVVRYLQKSNVETYMLSGDQKNHALRLAKEISINEGNVFAPLSPEEKSGFVKAFKFPCLFVGDGVNDSIAMSHSLVSVSMESAANVAFKSSDVHILSGGLGGIIELYELSSKYLNSIKYTIALSIVYNLIFACFALAGMMNPLVAVILMPISSLTITFLAVFLMSRESMGQSERGFLKPYLMLTSNVQEERL